MIITNSFASAPVPIVNHFISRCASKGITTNVPTVTKCKYVSSKNISPRAFVTTCWRYGAKGARLGEEHNDDIGFRKRKNPGDQIAQHGPSNPSLRMMNDRFGFTLIFMDPGAIHQQSPAQAGNTNLLMQRAASSSNLVTALKDMFRFAFGMLIGIHFKRPRISSAILPATRQPHPASPR